MLGPGGAQGLSGEKAHADLFFWRHSEAGLKTPDIISILCTPEHSTQRHSDYVGGRPHLLWQPGAERDQGAA